GPVNINLAMASHLILEKRGVGPKKAPLVAYFYAPRALISAFLGSTVTIKLVLKGPNSISVALS
ncbi:MAG: hypothetical protein MI754_18485, partial [Chromatiales bacterium]|nr:hypothetical protein [Chromatiales bacterium]